MREYERGPDGSWHDGLLLDLLPGDLAAADEAAQAVRDASDDQRIR